MDLFIMLPMRCFNRFYYPLLNIFASHLRQIEKMQTKSTTQLRMMLVCKTFGINALSAKATFAVLHKKVSNHHSSNVKFALLFTVKN